MLVREKIWTRTEPRKPGEKDWEWRCFCLYLETEGQIFFTPYFVGQVSNTCPGSKWVEIDPRTHPDFIYCGTEKTALSNILRGRDEVTISKESGDFSVHRSMARERASLPSEEEGWEISDFIRGDGTRPGPRFFVASKTMSVEEALEYLSKFPLELALSYDGVYPPYDDNGKCLLNIPRE